MLVCFKTNRHPSLVDGLRCYRALGYEQTCGETHPLFVSACKDIQIALHTCAAGVSSLPIMDEFRYVGQDHRSYQVISIM